MPFYQPSDAQSDLFMRPKRRDSLRHDKAVDRVHRSIPVSGMPRPGGNAAAPFGIGVVTAIVTTAITACTVSGGVYTPGTGACQLYYLEDDATTMTADTDNTSVTVYNWYQNSGTIAAGKSVLLGVWSGVYWFLDSDC